MNAKEQNYLDIIFKAVPLMSDFEKGRLLGYAEALGMKLPVTFPDHAPSVSVSAEVAAPEEPCNDSTS